MNQEGEKIKLYDSPLENNNDIKRSYFSFVPPFPPKYLPKFEGDTQFYGTIYHVDEKNVYFAIDILDNFAMIYVDTNMNKQLSNEEGQILFKELTIEINPFKDSKVKIRLNLCPIWIKVFHVLTRIYLVIYLFYLKVGFKQSISVCVCL